MTCYQGGKKRIGKKIFEIITLLEKDILGDEKLDYFEPFIGMGSVMKYFGKENKRKLFACDANEDLILLWKAIQKGWKPPLKCSKTKYEQLKNSKKHSAERAFIGIVASWGGMFFRNYRLDYNKEKDFLGEGYRGLMNIKPYMKNVKFYKASSYDTWEPSGMLIYCDPPYIGNNLGSDFFIKFNHDKFWNTMRKWSKKNIVVISESSAPKDFKKIWSTNSITSNSGKTKRYEDCLFIHKSIIKI